MKPEQLRTTRTSIRLTPIDRKLADALGKRLGTNGLGHTIRTVLVAYALGAEFDLYEVWKDAAEEAGG